MAKRTLKIKARFALVLVLLIPAGLALAGAGLYGLRSERNSAISLYTDHVQTTQATSDLGGDIGDAHVASLELLLDQANPVELERVMDALSSSISTDMDVGIATVRAYAVGNRDEMSAVQAISAGWNHLRRLRASGGLGGGSPTATAAQVREVDSIFTPMTNAVRTIVDIEAVQAHDSYEQALASYSSSVHLMLVVLILGTIIAIGLIISLVRSVLTRTLSCSAFARAVSEGDYSRRLLPRGNDEIDQLGATLEELAIRRQTEERYEKTKLEFTTTLLLTESEQEAHDLLKHYLERSIANSTITILNRNNSADRLDAVTEIVEGSVLSRTLVGAKPRSCLAVRMARPHINNFGDIDPLMACSVCDQCPGQTLCMPFIVGGEVIGSVVVNYDDEITDNEHRVVRETVMQAAPVLGNLRNLAIAELRSATDALTGLPNRRAIEDTLKRMVAQSSRMNTSLAALMCDLDHFKEVNDQFGHGSGDEVLAAVGATLIGTLRSSDFVGRYGGEEFLILLPATTIDGAVGIAELIRSAVSQIRVPSVADRVTLSVGVAVLPDHASDAVSLSRAADRALYAAKHAGRDRVEVFRATSKATNSEVEVTLNGTPVQERTDR